MSVIGDWIKGEFGDGTVTGFILEDYYTSFYFIIKTVEPKYNDEPLPRRLAFGEIHHIPKRVVQESFVQLNNEQQLELISQAKKLGEHEWAKELNEEFFNPFKKEMFMC